MAIINTIYEETNLAGTLQTQLTSTGLSVTARFYDTKTGLQKTPQASTLTFTVNKDTSKAELVKCDSHSTDANGVTTLTINAAGRALPWFGNGSGGATGNLHNPGASIGCATNTRAIAQLNKFVDGEEGSGANALRTGDETDSDIRYYAQNADGNKPYLGYDSATDQWVASNDGLSEIVLGGSLATYTGGAGITILAGAITVDTADTNVFVATSAGIADAGKGVILNGSGELNFSLIGPGPLADYISDVTATAAEINQALDGISANVTDAALSAVSDGPSSDADAYHTHTALGSFSGTAGEAIDGSTTPQAVCLAGDGLKQSIFVHNGGEGVADINVADPTGINFGDVDATTQRAQSFTPTDTTVDTLTLDELQVWAGRTGVGHADNVYIEIQTDNSNKPSGTVVTNGTSDVIAGTAFTLTNANELRPEVFEWSTPPELTAGTKYWWVIRRSGANDAAGYYYIGAGGDEYSSHSYSTYTASTLTWTTQASNDLQFSIFFTYNYADKIFKLDADDPAKCNFVGFTSDNVADDAAINVIPPYQLQSGFTGLTPGAPYYASTTAGAISATAADGNIKTNMLVGRARSATEIFIESSEKTYYLTTNATGINFNGAPGTDPHYGDIFIPTGFRPTEVTLIGYYKADDKLFEYKYTPSTIFGGMSWELGTPDVFSSETW